MRNKNFIVLLIAIGLSCFGLIGNAELTKVENLYQKIDIVGVSMLPPYERGWFVSKVHPGKVQFSKIINQTKSFIIQVSLSRIPEFETKEDLLKIVSKQRWRLPSDKRYKNLINKETYTEEKGTPAVRIHTKYEDSGSPYIPNGENYLIVEDYGIFCIHPENRGISVNIIFSQRSVLGKGRENWVEFANSFIKNVEFTKLPKE